MRNLASLIFLLLFQLKGFAQLASSAAGPIPNLHGNGMMFTPNKGQIVDAMHNLRPDVLFKGAGAGADIYLRKTGISYVLSNVVAVMQEVDEQVEQLEKQGKLEEYEESKKHEELMQTRLMKLQRIDVDFVNSLPSSAQVVLTNDAVEGYTNYYYPHCKEGITHVNSYNEVIVKNMYRNIDVIYKGNKDKGLKYDIIVNPGGQPSAIQLKYSGADKVYLQKGRLYIRTELGELEEFIPKVFQNINGRIVDVQASYTLKGTTVGFKLGEWDPRAALVIDPWVTYYGGNDRELASSITIDPSGNVILSGEAKSVNLPVSAGVFQTVYGGGFSDGAVIKFTSSGTRLFATYIGGTGRDLPNGITSDSNDNIIITGFTMSTDLPTKDAGGGAFYQSTISTGAAGVFVTKLTSSGTLTWSTYYDQAAFASGYDVCVDKSDNIFFTGCTTDPAFPVKAGAYQATTIGFYNAFVVKMDPNAVVQWATLYGGGSETPYGITADAAGDVIFCGSTAAANFPVVAAHQSTIGDPTQDGFIVKLNGSTGYPIWSTFYGGSDWDQCMALAADPTGNVYIGGTSRSANKISTPGSYQPAMTTTYQWEAFVVKFNPAGVRQWATYLGGSGAEEFSGVAIDPANNVVVVGDTYSKDFPVTSCAYQKKFAGSEDQFITSFDPGGKIICSSYLGIGDSLSPNNETGDPGGYGGSVAVNGCYIYLAASSNATYPVTTGAYQTTPGGDYDFVLAQLYLSTCGGVTSTLDFTGTQTTFCKGQPVDYTSTYTSCVSTAGTTYAWSFDGGTPATSTAQNPTGITYSTPGTYDVKLYIQTPCGKDSIVKSSYITVNSCTGCALTAQTSVVNAVTCNGTNTGNVKVNISNGSGGTYTYSWSNGINATTTGSTDPLSSIVAGTYTVKVTDGSCVTTSTVVLTNPPPIVVNTTSNKASCGSSNGSATASATGGNGNLTYSWSTTASGQTISALAANNYSVTVTDANGCTNSTTLTVGNSGGPTINAVNHTDPLCLSGTGNATASATGGSGTLSYSWSTTANGQTVNNLASGTYSITVSDASGCSNVSTVTIQVPPAIIATLTSTNTTCNLSNGTATLVSLSGGTGSVSYNWSTGSTATTLTNLSANTYTLVATDANGCTKQFTTTIINSGAGSVNSSVSAAIVCNGSSTGAILANITSGTAPYTYTWSNGPGGTTTGLQMSVNGLPKGTYTVTVSDANGCIGISTTNLTEPPALKVAATSLSANCGKTKGSAVVSANGGTGPYSYSWNTGVKTDTLKNVTTGTYSVLVADANGCTAFTNATVDSTGIGTINVTPATQTITEGNSVAITVSGGISYTWTPAVGLSCTACSNPEASPAASTVYTVTTTDPNGCVISAELLITVKPGCIGDDRDVFIANVFSPNGDGKNDVLYIEGNGLINIYWAIYDRWGNMLFEAFDQSHGWDGTKGGNPMENGTYVYYLKGTCVKSNAEVKLKGNVSILK